MSGEVWSFSSFCLNIDWSDRSFTPRPASRRQKPALATAHTRVPMVLSTSIWSSRYHCSMICWRLGDCWMRIEFCGTRIREANADGDTGTKYNQTLPGGPSRAPRDCRFFPRTSTLPTPQNVYINPTSCLFNLYEQNKTYNIVREIG
jgi:hypothetical protein